MDIWFYVGVGLLLWAIRDLIAGSTYLWDRFTRADNKGLYWFGAMLWLTVALLVLAYSPTVTYWLWS